MNIKEISERIAEKELDKGYKLRNLRIRKRGNNNITWVQFVDRFNIITGSHAHFEIIKRDTEIFVELHFENKDTKKQLKNAINKLTENIETFKWQNSYSLRVAGGVNIYDIDIIEKLIDKLVFIENKIGNEIRDFMIKKGIVSIKNKHNNQILYGPPGTGKTYNTINKALEIIIGSCPDDRKEAKKKYDELINDGRIVFTTFHQSMCYEDFVEGIKPLAPQTESNDTENVIYKVEDGIFKTICNTARRNKSNFDERIEWLKSESEESAGKTITINSSSTFDITYRGGRTFRIKPKNSDRPDQWYPASIENIRKMYEGAERKEVYNPTYVVGILDYLYQNGLEEYKNTKDDNKPYVIIIDEINRGNISQIFGELITLIESDKRIGNSEALEVTLPYSKERFGVPANLYIIGTMNTADRSVEALDTALRRRFNFVEKAPEPELFVESDFKGVNLKELLKHINDRIETLLDRDHLIGHSYFMKVGSVADLKDVFHNNIIPLLKEYFYGDYGKIGLVLGEGFVKKRYRSVEFANFNDYDNSVYQDKSLYDIVNVVDMDDDDFVKALEGAGLKTNVNTPELTHAQQN